MTATQLKGRELDEEAAEGTALTAAPKQIDFARPRFDQAQRGLTANEIGTAMHTVMQLIRLDHTGSVSEVAEEIARLEAQESLTPAAARAVRPDQVAAFFASPLDRRRSALRICAVNSNSPAYLRRPAGCVASGRGAGADAGRHRLLLYRP